ncbi:MAG: hypothetical protein K9H16_14825 [Bacteroidales bacterium]|nr:hypothetical protein [Bacteroidales bacterium]
MEESFEDISKTKPYTAKDFLALTDPHDGLGRTVPYQGLSYDSLLSGDDLKTIPYQAEMPVVKRTESHHIGVGDIVELNSISYTVLDLLTDEGQTAEAVIYKVKDKNDRLFVLKLYYEFNDPHLEPNSDTLQRIRDIGGKDILLLHDFGTGPNKYLEKFCFEITDFAAGSDLLKVENIKQKFTPSFIENTLIPAIHRGLCTLHHEKIYHCDLKPQNVFFLDQEQSKIVIGDYGSAKSFEKSSEKELSYTTMIKGTEFYLAPEQAFGIVSEKNDYYSLGMIVLHLIYPEQVNKQNLIRIFERRTKGLHIIDFDDNFERLNTLIQGLTLQDYNNRWGEAEVNAWIEGKEVIVNYGKLPEVRHLEIGDLIIRTGKDLAAYIAGDSRFYEQLIEDIEGYRLLMAWVRSIQSEQSMKQFDAMVSHYKKFFGINYVKEALLFYFNPSHQVSVGLENFDFNNTQLIGKLTADFFKSIDTLWKITDFDTMRIYFFRFEFALRRLRVKSDRKINLFIDQTLGAISQIVETAYNDDFSDFKADIYIQLKNENLPEIFHHFNDKRFFRDLRGNTYTSLFEVCEFLKTNPPKSDDDHLQLEKAAFLKITSKDEFTEFIEFCNTIGEMFFVKDVDFELLVRQMLIYCEDNFNKKSLREILQYYRHENNHILRELIFRLVNPEIPVKILGTNVYLYRQGSFQNKVEEFFVALDNVRLNADFEIIEKAFFGFEFCLLQLKRKNQLIGNSLVEPVLEKINNILQTSPPDASKLRAVFYRQIDEKSLLNMLYAFLPSRVFCTHAGDFLNHIQDIGLYYLQFPAQYTQTRSAIEREAFLYKSGHRGLINLGFDDFIMKVFQSKTDFDVKIRSIVYDENAANEISFYYDYENSVNDYLDSKGIKSNFIVKNQVLNCLVIDRKIYSSSNEIFERFVAAIRKKHTYGKLLASTRDSFDAAFKKSRKADFHNSFLLIPRYFVYLLPAFGMVYLSLSYMLDNSLFKQISFNLSPTLNLISVRLITSNYANLLLVAYFLNVLTGLLLLVPLLSLRRLKNRFKVFSLNYGALVSRFTLILVFAPFFFIAIYNLIHIFWEDTTYTISSIGLELNAINASILLYIFFMFYQTLIVIGAFFKVSRKIRFWPMLLTVCIYLALGYFAVVQQNLHSL